RIAYLVYGLQVFAAADIHLKEPDTIERRNQRMGEFLVGDPECGSEVAYIEHVFAVCRKVVIHYQSAAGSQRQAGDVGMLVAGGVIRGAAGAWRRVADSLRHHDTCGRQRLIEKGRRGTQRFGDVVESFY